MNRSQSWRPGIRTCLLGTLWLVACWLVAWVPVARLLADTPNVASAQVQSPQVARGVVFEDLNRNGQRDPGEPGLPGVRVSNGSEIVSTDAEGRYEVAVDDDSIIFVIKPRNYMTPVSEHNLPRFYYIHKPAGSPAHFRYAGVAPTGPLPDSVDFGLYRRDEPDKFRVLMFGDPQPRDLVEVQYMAHDVIAQVIAEEGHGAALGVTLGDIVFDDLDVMEPHNQVISLIGLPWYNVLGNHDMNYDAEDDRHSDATFQRVYGPAYYAFDHGPTHFIVLDDVTWVGAQNGQRGSYFGGLGPRQMTFLRNDLAGIPEDQLVVLMMHIPLTDVRDRQELYRLIEQRPAVVSISAHTHNMEHRFIGAEDDWRGTRPHHHIVNVTVCGSWWSGKQDERGIPHATMSDGGPNGYSIMEFDGNRYSLEFRAAGRPADYQMNIYAPESVRLDQVLDTQVVVNVFAGCDHTRCEMRVGEQSDWTPLEQVRQVDPGLVAEKSRDASLADRKWRDLPAPHETPHIWRGTLAEPLPLGAHTIEVRVTWPHGESNTGHRVIRVEPAEQPVSDS